MRWEKLQIFKNCRMSPRHLHLYHSSDFPWTSSSCGHCSSGTSWVCSTHRGVRLCFCHRLNPQVWTYCLHVHFFSNDSTVLTELPRQGTESTYCSHTHKEPPLLLAWFQSCSLIKLFKMCSWHFNTHFHFECDDTFEWKWKAIIKLAYYQNNSNVFFRGLHEKSMKSQLA